MPRPRPAENEAVGQDSFLDVVTNIVGILIILVMVVGIRAKQAPAEESIGPESTANQEIAPLTPVATKPTEPVITDEQLAKQRTELEALESDLKQAQVKHDTLTAQSQEIEQQTALIQKEHLRQRMIQERLNTLMAMGRIELEEIGKKFSGNDQQQFEIQQQLLNKQQELQQTQAAAQALQSKKPTTVEVAMQGTPLSKIVDGTEVHFQIRGERVAYVPLEELIEFARKDMKPEVNAMKSLADLQNSTEKEFRTRARRGFEMRYRLMINTDGTGNRVSIGLARFELVPTQASLGETLTEAMAPQSQFRMDLREASPRNTTVTLWVYADSFALYRAVQEEIRKLGYQVAGRLMPMELPIAGSPQGKKSLAQ
jgi:hypothetical protein